MGRVVGTEPRRAEGEGAVKVAQGEKSVRIRISERQGRVRHVSWLVEGTKRRALLAPAGRVGGAGRRPTKLTDATTRPDRLE